MKSFTLFFIVLFAAVAMTMASPGGWRRATMSILETRGLNNTERDPTTFDKRGSQITFYGGSDLKNAACYGRNGLKPFNAKPTDMIAAMWMSGLEMCYKCLQIKRGNKQIIVKVIDKCAGCPKHGSNVDLTITGFKKLANPTLGRVGISWRGLPKCPSSGAWPVIKGK